MSSAPQPVWRAEYEAARAGAAYFDLNNWTQIELRGDDRVKFLHNLCTNDIKGLAPGAGCEAFLLNVQGKILFHVLVFSEPDALLLFTVPREQERLLAHLDRYLIREQVTLRDRTADWTSVLVSGPKATSALESMLDVRAADQLYATVWAAVADCHLWLRRVEIAGNGNALLHFRRADADHVRRVLEAKGVVPCGQDAFEAARIETGFPLYGRDITDSNLPQEVGRDRWAIHFNKGCYLGQETVARIDALGHVNWKLSGLRFDSREIPAPGLELKHGDKIVGRVTSSSYSPLANATLALGYVRREHAGVGERLDSENGQADVISLPIPQ